MNAAADPPSAADPLAPVAVEPPITLGRFLKLVGLAASGGDAKLLITSRRVLVNGEVETRRGRQLWPGDTVESQGRTATLGPVSRSPARPSEHPE